MIKYSANKYYAILLGFAVYLLFNLIVRDKLLDWIFNLPPDKPIANANNFAHEMLVKDVFVYSIIAYCLAMFILSLMLLFTKQDVNINKRVLIIVPVLIAVVFMAFIIMAGSIGGNIIG